MFELKVICTCILSQCTSIGETEVIVVVVNVVCVCGMDLANWTDASLIGPSLTLYIKVIFSSNLYCLPSAPAAKKSIKPQETSRFNHAYFPF
jgi:hypothetical protein